MNANVIRAFHTARSLWQNAISHALTEIKIFGDLLAPWIKGTVWQKVRYFNCFNVLIEISLLPKHLLDWHTKSFVFSNKLETRSVQNADGFWVSGDVLLSKNQTMLWNVMWIDRRRIPKVFYENIESHFLFSQKINPTFIIREKNLIKPLI